SWPPPLRPHASWILPLHRQNGPSRSMTSIASPICDSISAIRAASTPTTRPSASSQYHSQYASRPSRPCGEQGRLAPVSFDQHVSCVGIVLLISSPRAPRGGGQR